MSRIGNRELKIPTGVEITVQPNNVIVKGTKGQLEQKIPNVIKVEAKDGVVKTTRVNEVKHTKQLHGTINSLIQGMIQGVSVGFKKELEISGVGYKANLQGDKLMLNLGFSHPIEYHIPKGITLTVPKPTQITVEGISKQLVGEVAANIRNFKKPEPYKGKGIKYKNEHIIRKEGKSAGK
ncbi:50S ribosomal protein L6 [Spiroplasma eriocheiris]|uniref:Large ribosomal subunit protein uL6 n=1 Tax=Spiroplasma eriocheiris TaxID=315358 RepID=A0A0H3XHQ1_9MOLU|nr:50S ribosomal protein L6 [Spiroplasma eriocheiris]AHF57429.1 50S ribosomal protein L6 [Spiroplasma eriocheiris CCTCC M 207170]AKM53885.1 50S ribosomal protein L6 [Spiroplasma eriocheiris]